MPQPHNKLSESRWSYLKVAELIRQEILGGIYKPGKRLPGEPALAKRFGVGRVTIARALDVLDQANLVFRVRGSGTYIQRDVARGAVRLTIGYLVHDVDALRHSPSGMTLEAAHQYLEELGHTVRLLTRSELFAAGEPPAVLRRMVRAGSLDGLIVSYAIHPGFIRRINDIVPMMLVVNDYLPAGMLNVAVDFMYGYFATTQHLVSLGHRRIGLLGGNRETSIGYRATQAFRLALQRVGVDADCLPISHCGFDPASYPDCAEAMLRENPDLSAVVCIDDEAAVAVVQAAARLGRAVPQDLSVVGCNDLPVASASMPPLTTLRIDFAKVGRLSVELLLARIFGRTAPSQLYVRPELIVRDSTASPPSLDSQPLPLPPPA